MTTTGGGVSNSSSINWRWMWEGLWWWWWFGMYRARASELRGGKKWHWNGSPHSFIFSFCLTPLSSLYSDQLFTVSLYIVWTLPAWLPCMLLMMPRLPPHHYYFLFLRMPHQIHSLDLSRAQLFPKLFSKNWSKWEILLAVCDGIFIWKQIWHKHE